MDMQYSPIVNRTSGLRMPFSFGCPLGLRHDVMSEEQAMMRLKGEVASYQAPDLSRFRDTLDISTGSTRPQQRTETSYQTSQLTPSRANKAILSAEAGPDIAAPHKNLAFVIPEFISACLSKVESPD